MGGRKKGGVSQSPAAARQVKTGNREEEGGKQGKVEVVHPHEIQSF